MKTKKNLIQNLLIALLLSGCAAALVPQTEDPNVKLGQATALYLNQNRPQAAVKLFHEALTLAETKNDQITKAQALFSLGEMYKLPPNRGADFSDVQKAISYYEDSAATYAKLAYYKNQALVLWSQSGAYSIARDEQSACRSILKAQKVYHQKDAHQGDRLSPSFSGGKLEESIAMHVKKCQ